MSDPKVLTRNNKVLLNNQGKVLFQSIPNYLYAEALGANTLIYIGYSGTSVPSYNLQYRLGESGSWQNYTISTRITLTNVGDKVYFRGNNSSFSGGSSSTSFYIRSYYTGYEPFKIGGDITTLLRYQGEVLDLTSYGSGVFSYLFGWNSAGTVADASDLILPSTTLTDSCYLQMFASCDNLTHIPKLPATTMAPYCYWRMFGWCDLLEEIPALPATTLANGCYSGMFLKAPKIKISETQTGEYTNAFTFGTTPSSTTASDMFEDTGGTFTGSPTKQTYYTSNTIIS